MAAPRRRATVLFNPTAGRRKRRRLDAILAATERLGCAVTLLETGAPGDAIRLARGLSCADADVLAVAGGDGTVNEAINGRLPDGPPVAVLPMGSANLVALELGLPRSPSGLAHMLVHGAARPAYPARIDGRLFLLMAGAGFDAHVVARLPLRLKRAFGMTAYALVSLRQLAEGFAFSDYEVEIDGVPHRAASVVVAKGHYYAGPYVCARAASIERREIHVCLFERPGRGQVVRYAFGLFSGRLERMAGYRVIAARRVAIRGPAGEPLQLDGDDFGTLPVAIEADGGTVPLIRAAGP